MANKNHDKAYGTMHTRDLHAATTRSGAKTCIQVNSRPLETVIEKESLRSEDVWNWKAGKMETRDLDVLTNAQRQINKVCVVPVTNGRRRRRENKNNEGPGGYAAVPTLGGRY